ncbi:hypothetical protein LUW76_39315 [Actinomadura madurae]|uniref:hypothetical protein n=1 Tax=Actinomadura madurae TaxID=1993 RepID=UPI0020264B76|nr:hypothetical protein [Actinomadura madurae]URM99883.1 hypothetical protein LUW76_39315 [Actinomadura madurae]
MTGAETAPGAVVHAGISRPARTSSSRTLSPSVLAVPAGLRPRAIDATAQRAVHTACEEGP